MDRLTEFIVFDGVEGINRELDRRSLSSRQVVSILATVGSGLRVIYRYSVGSSDDPKRQQVRPWLKVSGLPGPDALQLRRASFEGGC